MYQSKFNAANYKFYPPFERSPQIRSEPNLLPTRLNISDTCARQFLYQSVQGKTLMREPSIPWLRTSLELHSRTANRNHRNQDVRFKNFICCHLDQWAANFLRLTEALLLEILGDFKLQRLLRHHRGCPLSLESWDAFFVLCGINWSW